MSRNASRIGWVEGVIILVLCILALVTAYPFIYVASMSLSDPKAVIELKVWLWPKGFSLEAYGLIFGNSRIWVSYYNTIWYTVVGTALNIFLTLTFAYPLSRKDFSARGIFMILLAVTMFFNSGLITNFLLIQKLGLYNTRWAIVLPGAMGAMNVIMARVFFQTSIPDSLTEAAKIDGATDIKILMRIVVPLSLPIISVVAIFSSVGYWNNYFNAMIYLIDKNLQPLQIYLMEVLIQNNVDITSEYSSFSQREELATQLKYCIIMVSIIPIMCFYPILQKYFVKGAMIGALKE